MNVFASCPERHQRGQAHAEERTLNPGRDGRQPMASVEAAGRPAAVHAQIARNLPSATPLMSLSPAGVAC